MQPPDLNWIANFIWGIADDVLRDLYVRGKYRDVILPITVLRRLDAVLEPTKARVLETKAWLDRVGITSQDGPLRDAARQAFYNTSRFTLRDLRARGHRQQLRADFEAYLDGFSENVQDILDNFEFRHQIPRLSRADALGTLIEKFLDPAINLGPEPVLNADGSVRVPGLDNHAMGTIFEELVRRFNEENNEEAGEHWTPRDAVRLMARLVILPIADQIESGTYLLYDGACGTGGMLTVAEETLLELARERGKRVSTHLYGQEIPVSIIRYVDVPDELGLSPKDHAFPLTHRVRPLGRRTAFCRRNTRATGGFKLLGHDEAEQLQVRNSASRARPQELCIKNSVSGGSVSYTSRIGPGAQTNWAKLSSSPVPILVSPPSGSRSTVKIDCKPTKAGAGWLI